MCKESTFILKTWSELQKGHACVSLHVSMSEASQELTRGLLDMHGEEMSAVVLWASHDMEAM